MLPVAHSRHYVAHARLLLLSACVLMLTACGIANPLAVEGLSANQRAGAVLNSYNAILEPAVVLVEDESLSREVRRPIQQAILAAAPIMDGLDSALEEFNRAADLFAQGQTTAERIDLVTANLERWITLGEAAYANLKSQKEKAD